MNFQRTNLTFAVNIFIASIYIKWIFQYGSVILMVRELLTFLLFFPQSA